MSECVCPHCGIEYERHLPIEFVTSGDVWKRNNRFVVFCEECREKLKPRRKGRY